MTLESDGCVPVRLGALARKQLGVSDLLPVAKAETELAERAQQSIVG